MFSGSSVLNYFAFKIFLQYIRVGGTDSFVVILFQIDNFKAEFLIKFNRTFVVHLNVPEKVNEIEVANVKRKSGKLTGKCCQSFRQPRRTSKYDSTWLSRCRADDKDTNSRGSWCRAVVGLPHCRLCSKLRQLQYRYNKQALQVHQIPARQGRSDRCRTPEI